MIQDPMKFKEDIRGRQVANLPLSYELVKGHLLIYFINYFGSKPDNCFLFSSREIYKTLGENEISS